MAWDAADYLLADQADSLRWLVWAKSKDGARNRKRPKPVPRPGTPTVNKDVESMTVDDMKAYLARPRIPIAEPNS